jgi:hypothetical protein
MTDPENDPVAGTGKGGMAMEFIIPLGVLAVWVILQVWVLPRLGMRS